MKKILYVILHTCTRPDRHDGVVNTWAKDVDYIFYADCDNEEKKIIKVSDDSTYSSNQPKHVNVIKYLIENDYQYEWFFFCDDDTFVNTKNLEHDFSIFDKDKVNGSVLEGTWAKDKTLNYCSGGAGYLIHKTLLEIISQNIKIGDSGYSDVTLGLCIKELGIENKNFNEFHSQSPKYYKMENSKIKEVFTFHYIQPNEMETFYKLLK